MSEAGTIPGMGTFFVGIDMPPGRYRCSNGKNGWWVLFSGTAGDTPVGAWPLEPGPAEVDITPEDFAFETHVPTSWTLVAPAPSQRHDLRPVADPTLRGELDSLVANRSLLLRLIPVPLISLAVLAYVALGDLWAWLLLPLALLAFTSRRLMDDFRRARALGRRADRYLTVSAFDSPARDLLSRVQRATDAVRNSRVVAEGLLDGIDPAVELPRQEWEIAQILARQSKLRRDEEALTLSPEVEELLRPQKEKLAISVAAVTRRVEALERYAARTLEADMAYRACRQLEDLAERSHEYDELLADTVRHELAVPAIDRLTAQSDDLLSTLQQRLADATDAALPLKAPHD